MKDVITRTAPTPPVSDGVPGETPRRAGAAAGRRAGSRSKPAQPIAFLVPAILVMVVFFIVPSVYNLVYAFTDWSSFKSSINPVGLRNFANIFNNGTLLGDLKVNVIYAVLVAIFQNVFGLALALLLEADTKLNRFARTMFFIPVLLSALAVGYIFQALLKPTGTLNTFLSWMTGADVDYAWLNDTTWTLLWLTVIHAWKWMGLAMLIYLAGLKTISADVLEACRLDGASRWQTFRHVKLPFLAPALTFNVATALLGSMNSFDIVQATTGGGPGQTTEILNIFIYRTFGQGLFAQATTMSLVLVIVISLMAFPTIILLRRRERAL
ncbi:carbohydrate ABC transporter permease [Terrabacter sp. MAHUQ-38]|uniref:carbohydrate ABC transporter permease n=1 Tax=unclassified Terrabacter TaxID=2630222 RepID=UPI00351C8621